MSTLRQLAALMFVDISGYTAMMQEDEAKALKVRNKLQQKIEEQVKLEHGRLIKEIARLFETKSDRKFSIV